LLCLNRSKEIELNVQGQDLTIIGEHQTSNEKKNANYLDQEFSYARLHERSRCPKGGTRPKLELSTKNGFFEVTAPIKESALQSE